MEKKNYFDRLMGMTKEIISLLAASLGTNVSKSLKKTEMAKELTDYVVENAHEWLRGFSKMELDIVWEIADPWSEGKCYPLYEPVNELCLENFKMLDCEFDKNDEMYFTMPDELIFAVRKGLPKAMEFRKDNHYLDFERVSLGILNTYGIIDTDEFMDTFYRVFDLKHDERLVDSAIYFIAESKMLASAMEEIDGVRYYLSPSVDETLAESILEERKSRPMVLKKKEFTKEQYMSAGMDELCPVVGEDSPSGKRLRAYLRAKNVNNEDVPGFFSDLWEASQQPGKMSVKEAMDIMGDLGFTSMEDINDGMSCVMEYFNNVPRWTLYGYSSAEISGKFEKPSLRPLPDLNPVSPPQGSYNALSMLGDVMNGTFTKVGRNDPCPCGSGKKYKNCHGKES